MRTASIALCVALAASAVCAAEKQAPRAKFVRLFDGKSLEGWEGNLAGCRQAEKGPVDQAIQDQP